MRRPTTQRGFTLLEVMLAFTILSVLMTYCVSIIHDNMEVAADAIDQRELREIADTVFGKILFEQAEHRDGDQGSIDVTYGQWAGLKQERADRYAVYRWRLQKKELVAAGVADTTGDAENMFDKQDDTKSGSSSSSSSSTPKAGDPAADKGNVNLVKFVLEVFHTEAPDQPLITLARYLPPPDFGTTKR